VARVTAYTSPTVVNAVVLTDFGATTASSDWWEGRWSDRRGWPSAVCLHESRMGMFGSNIDLSISDAYEDFDDEFEGDAGPISRSIGEGPIESINWALSLTRLIIGTPTNSANLDALKIQGNSPLSGRSSSLDEPLTPTNFNLKTASPTGMFVDTSTTRLMELKFEINENDYVSEDLCIAVPDLNSVGIAGIAVQYKPDMRVHCWRTDGTVGLMVRDRAENLTCWFEIETDGVVEDVCVHPGTVEDTVYYVVRRTINGATVRYIEKWALESECIGGTVNKQADAFITGTNSPARKSSYGRTARTSVPRPTACSARTRSQAVPSRWMKRSPIGWLASGMKPGGRVASRPSPRLSERHSMCWARSITLDWCCSTPTTAACGMARTSRSSTTCRSSRTRKKSTQTMCTRTTTRRGWTSMAGGRRIRAFAWSPRRRGQ
jgi:hypothetical protein